MRYEDQQGLARCAVDLLVFNSRAIARTDPLASPASSARRTAGKPFGGGLGHLWDTRFMRATSASGPAPMKQDEHSVAWLRWNEILALSEWLNEERE